jgi:TPR repeat protein
MNKKMERFERAAAKGHEESGWILGVWSDVEWEQPLLQEAFAKREEPLAWYFAGLLLTNRERRFDWYKKSAEGGCSWGQVDYGLHFERGEFVGEDMKVCVGWLEKAAGQDNPRAMQELGDWFRNDGEDKEKAASYYRRAAELGWTDAMHCLADMLKFEDLRQAAVWSAKAGSWTVVLGLMDRARRGLETGTKDQRLGCDFNQLCYLLGWGMYWYPCHHSYWKRRKEEDKVFGNDCISFYCSCVELQRESIFTFLWFWNRSAGVKDVGELIGKMVWEGREDNLVMEFSGNKKVN